MKRTYFFQLTVFVLISFFGCKKEVSNTEIVEVTKVATIDTLEVFSFRRSYVDHHLLSEKEYEKLFELNPVLDNYSRNKQEQKLLSQLHKLKILEREESTFMLNLKYFENFNPKEVKYLDAENRISFDYELDLTKSNSINLKIKNNGMLIEKTIDFERENLIGMTLEDIDSDGVKDILILLNYYIMNGDNYILMMNKFVK